MLYVLSERVQETEWIINILSIFFLCCALLSHMKQDQKQI